MRIIGGKYRGKKISFPLSQDTRPTSERTREMIFNILAHNSAFEPAGLEDKAVLDVCAGTGALGLEALSRGASSVTFIENNRHTLSILRQNIQAFELPSSCILEKDATHLGPSPSLFDLVFLDPPYGQHLMPPILPHLYSQKWLSSSAVVVGELGKNDPIPLLPFLSVVTERSSKIKKIIFLKMTKNIGERSTGQAP